MRIAAAVFGNRRTPLGLCNSISKSMLLHWLHQRYSWWWPRTLPVSFMSVPGIFSFTLRRSPSMFTDAHVFEMMLFLCVSNCHCPSLLLFYTSKDGLKSIHSLSPTRCTYAATERVFLLNIIIMIIITIIVVIEIMIIIFKLQ